MHSLSCEKWSSVTICTYYLSNKLLKSDTGYYFVCWYKLAQSCDAPVRIWICMLCVKNQRHTLLEWEADVGLEFSWLQQFSLPFTLSCFLSHSLSYTDTPLNNVPFLTSFINFFRFLHYKSYLFQYPWNWNLVCNFFRCCTYNYNANNTC